MIWLRSEESLTWLFWIAWVNLGGGAVVWIFSTLALTDDGLPLDERMSVVAWQTIGSNWIGFGILVLVITLAANAVVEGHYEAIESKKSRKKK